MTPRLPPRLPPGLLISAPASGAGKTTVTLGLARALSDRGLAVQAFKCGPDYIDPAFHAAATGRASVNLDAWAMTPALIAGLAERAAGADLILAEGAMGLFDGVAQRGEAGTGASADIAALTGWPVALVLDVSGQAQTAAAVARGLATHRAGVRVAGVTVFGALRRETALVMPQRHLGLVQASEQAGLEPLIAEAARLAATQVDLDALLAAAGPASAFGAPFGAPPRPRPPGARIALARDAAFSFTYPHLLEGWRAAGAEIAPFSPLADEPPDPAADVCWLPGGYPELHAGRLAAAARFRAGLRAFAETRPVHGECGGYMAMGAGLIDADGARHEMAGLLGLVTSFARRRMRLGYRLATLAAPIPGHDAGARLRGHEFHYSAVVAQPDAPLAAVADAGGAPVAETGSWRGRASGSYFHLIAAAT